MHVRKLLALACTTFALHQRPRAGPDQPEDRLGGPARLGADRLRRRDGGQDQQGLQRRPQGRAPVHRQRAGNHHAGGARPARDGQHLVHRHLGADPRGRGAEHAVPVEERRRARLRHRQLRAAGDEEDLRVQGPGDPGAGRSRLERRGLQEGLPDAGRRQGHEGARVAGAVVEDVLGRAQHQRRADAAVRAVPGAAERPGRRRGPALPVLHHHAGGAERAALRDDAAPAPRLHLRHQQGRVGQADAGPAEAGGQPRGPKRRACARRSPTAKSRRWPSSRPRAASCTS